MKALERAGRGRDVRTILIADASARAALVDLVCAGDRIQLSDPAFRRELLSWLRFNNPAALRTGDGLSGKAAGQLPLPDWLAKRVIRFVLTGDKQAATDAENMRSSPVIAVIVARGASPADWVEVGRAYERLALQAATMDIRTAFINQPIEVGELLPQLNSLIGLAGETASLMLRIGYGPRAPFSLRRPVDDVILREAA
jgi:hypothetical protein